MTDWKAERETLVNIFPPGYQTATPAEQQILAEQAARTIKECRFDAWPETPARETLELFKLIRDTLPEAAAKHLDSVTETIEQAIVTRPDLESVPGQAVYTTPANRYGQEGRALDPGEWPLIESYHKPAFPLDTLPEWLQALVTALHKESGAALDYYAGTALAIASMAVFDRASVILDGGREQPLILYSIMVGPSGTKKSAAFATMGKPLIEWMEARNADTAKQHKRIDGELQILQKELETARKGKQNGTQAARTPEAIHADMDALEEQKRPFYPVPLTDATMESIARESQKALGAVSVLSDEGQIINAIAGKTYAGKDGAPNIDSVLRAYDREFVNISRSTYAVKGRMALALCIGAQPAILDTLITHGEQAERGFPQRCLFFYPAPVFDDALTRVPCPQELKAQWHNRVLDLLTAGRTSPLDLEATPEAITLWKQYENSMTERRREDRDAGEVMGGWYGKAHDKMARVAALLALLEDPKARAVTEQHIKAAIRLFDEYAIPMARECYGLEGNALPKHLAAVLQAAIQEKTAKGAALEGAVYRRLHNLTRYRNGNPRTFDRDITELQERGYIRRAQADPGRRGRPTAYILVNPYLRE